MCKNLRVFLIGAALGFAASGIARAAEPAQRTPSAPKHPTALPVRDGEAAVSDPHLVSELIQINERIVLLSAKLKELQLQAKIAASRDAAGQSPSGADLGTGFASTLPVVGGIHGVGTKLRAKLAWGNGIVSSVAVGDRLPGGWRVTQIKPNTVELARAGKRVRLGFGMEPAAAPPGTPLVPASSSATPQLFSHP